MYQNRIIKKYDLLKVLLLKYYLNTTKFFETMPFSVDMIMK